MGWTLAIFQKHPKAKPEYIGIYFLSEDGRVWVQTKQSLLPYKATLVTANHDVVMSNCEGFLVELARQAKPSQISYQYTQNQDLAEEVRTLLLTAGSVQGA